MGVFSKTTCDVCGCTIHGEYKKIIDINTGRFLYNICPSCDEEFIKITKNQMPYPLTPEETEKIVSPISEEMQKMIDETPISEEIKETIDETPVSYIPERYMSKNEIEIRNHNVGTILLIIGFVLIVIGCAAGAVWLIPITVGIIFVGFIKMINNRSRYRIEQEEALWKTTQELKIAQAKAGVKIDAGESQIVQNARKNKETKKIVKGAVVGSIIAGDVGAVVGATIAKNNIDNEKKK